MSSHINSISFSQVLIKRIYENRLELQLKSRLMGLEQKFIRNKKSEGIDT